MSDANQETKMPFDSEEYESILRTLTPNSKKTAIHRSTPNNRKSSGTILSPQKATPQQKALYGVDWIVTPIPLSSAAATTTAITESGSHPDAAHHPIHDDQSKTSFLMDTDHQGVQQTVDLETFLETTSYAYIPNHTESSLLTGTPSRNGNEGRLGASIAKPQRISPPSQPSPFLSPSASKRLDASLLSSHTQGGSQIQYAVLDGTSKKFKDLTDDQESTVIISPVRRSVRLEANAAQNSPRSQLYRSLNDVPNHINYAWLPNAHIKKNEI